MSANDPRETQDARYSAESGTDPIQARRERMAQRLRDELAALVAMDLLQGLTQGKNGPRRQPNPSQKAA